MARSKKQQLLQRAAELMGREELAVRLKVPMTMLSAWLNGHATMPDRKLIVLANVLDQFSTKP